MEKKKKNKSYKILESGGRKKARVYVHPYTHTYTCARAHTHIHTLTYRIYTRYKKQPHANDVRYLN